MNYVKSGVALAIVFAVTVFGGSAVYADDASQVVVARNPSQTQTTKTTSVEASKTSEITVQPGDSLSAIAARYGTTLEQILALNTITNPDVIEIDSVLQVPGDGQVVAVESESYDKLKAAASAFITPPAPVVAPAPSARVAQNPTATRSASTSYYVGNGMWCTDYVHSRRPDVPIYGNAGYNWISAAQAQGRATGTVARAGAIAVMNGHVAYVESVNADGSYTVSEMGWNYQAGNFNQRTVNPGAFGGFIY